MSVWQELGPDVYRRRYEVLDLNVGVVVGGEGVLVIDTRASQRQARETLAELRTLTPLPVRWVLNTHWHWDHCWGNAEFPGAELWGHPLCRERLLMEGAAMKSAVLEHVDEEHHPEIEEVEIVPPDHLIPELAVLDLGGRTVEVRHPGRGHTDADLVVIAGDVLFAGDLVEEGAPPSFGDAYPAEWAPTLDRVLPLIAGPVVPGHGDVVDRAFVAAQRDEIAAVADLAVRVYDSGTAAGDAAIQESPYPEDVTRTAIVAHYRAVAESW